MDCLIALVWTNSETITEAQWDTASTPHHLERKEVIANQQAPRKPPSTQAPCTAHNHDAQSSHLQSQKELRTSPPSNIPRSLEDRPWTKPSNGRWVELWILVRAFTYQRNSGSNQILRKKPSITKKNKGKPSHLTDIANNQRPSVPLARMFPPLHWGDLSATGHYPQSMKNHALLSPMSKLNGDSQPRSVSTKTLMCEPTAKTGFDIKLRMGWGAELPVSDQASPVEAKLAHPNNPIMLLPSSTTWFAISIT